MGGLTVLLDTHALLWALADPGSLSRRARTVIADPETTLRVSAASAWELATKARIGKLPGVGPLLFTYQRHIARLGARELPVTSEHTLLAGSFAWDHRDPFDRMLAAQCVIEGLTLVTKDSAFADASGVRTLW
jgi:PIN domain nuclease of toxin-antitoxin system